MSDHHRSLDRALARAAAPAERFAAVLAEHEYAVGLVLGGAPMICRCGAVRKPAHDEPLQDLHRAHVAAALAAVADDGLAERVRGLADEWEAVYDRWAGVGGDVPKVAIFRAHANRLRALLSGAPSADRDERDGA